eukprot:g10262.t1
MVVVKAWSGSKRDKCEFRTSGLSFSERTDGRFCLTRTPETRESSLDVHRICKPASVHAFITKVQVLNDEEADHLRQWDGICQVRLCW